MIMLRYHFKAFMDEDRKANRVTKNRWPVGIAI
jgi:hypothetical protein